MSAISDQYAVALFELALERDNSSNVEQSFSSFCDALDDESRMFFTHPVINKSDKIAALKALDLDNLLHDFLHTLIENNRFEFVQQIYTQYVRLLEDAHKIMTIQVISARNLPEAKITQLKEHYQKKYQRKVTIETHINSKIVGGLRIEYKGIVIDDTVHTRINRIRSRLTK